MPRDCLIIVDMLNDYLDRRDGETRARLIGNMNQLIARFRSAGCPVLWVRQSFEPDLSDAFLEMRDRQKIATVSTNESIMDTLRSGNDLT